MCARQRLAGKDPDKLEIVCKVRCCVAADEAAAAMLAVMENVQNAINDGEDQDGSSLGNEEEPPEEF